MRNTTNTGNLSDSAHRIQVNEIVDTYGNSEELPQLWERDSSGRLAPGGIWVVN